MLVLDRKPKLLFYNIRVVTERGGTGKYVTHLHWRGMTLQQHVKWTWYFKYRGALLRIKYPRYLIDETWGSYTPEGRTLEEMVAAKLKQDITTKRRMITKFTNVIRLYEEEESKSLLPNLTDPRYLRTKEKLLEYQFQLINLTNEQNLERDS
jgi:hypothetical protein